MKIHTNPSNWTWSSYRIRYVVTHQSICKVVLLSHSLVFVYKISSFIRCVTDNWNCKMRLYLCACDSIIFKIRNKESRPQFTPWRGFNYYYAVIHTNTCWFLTCLFCSIRAFVKIHSPFANLLVILKRVTNFTCVQFSYPLQNGRSYFLL